MKRFVVAARGVSQPTIAKAALVDTLTLIPGVQVLSAAGPAVLVVADKDGLSRLREALGSNYHIEEEVIHGR